MSSACARTGVNWSYCPPRRLRRESVAPRRRVAGVSWTSSSRYRFSDRSRATLDLIVIDEAHGVCGDSDRYAARHTLAKLTCVRAASHRDSALRR